MADIKPRLTFMQRKYLLRANIQTLEPTYADQTRICLALVGKGLLRESEEFPGIFEITEDGEATLS